MLIKESLFIHLKHLMRKDIKPMTVKIIRGLVAVVK